MPDQLYTWMKTSPTSGKMVSRIPFQHPVQIYNIIQCLRQQQMFNTLFKSIFNVNTYKTQQKNTSISFSLQDILAGKFSWMYMIQWFINKRFMQKVKRIKLLSLKLQP